MSSWHQVIRALQQVAASRDAAPGELTVSGEALAGPIREEIL